MIWILSDKERGFSPQVRIAANWERITQNKEGVGYLWFDHWCYSWVQLYSTHGQDGEEAKQRSTRYHVIMTSDDVTTDANFAHTRKNWNCSIPGENAGQVCASLCSSTRALLYTEAPNMAAVDPQQFRSKEPSHIPGSTYRFQFHRDFPLTKGTEAVDYLSDLGITDLYSSPLLNARPGSTHGYDCVDHSKLNDEIGTADQFVTLSEALKKKGNMKIIS